MRVVNYLIRCLAVAMVIGVLLLPTIVSAFSGDIGEVLDEQAFQGDATFYQTSLCQMSDDEFVTLFSTNYGLYLYTFNITDVDITTSDNTKPSSNTAWAGNIVHRSGDIYVYSTCFSTSPRFYTLDIDSDTGTIGSYVDSYIPASGQSNVGQFSTDIIHISGDVFLIGYPDTSNFNHLETITIDSSGNIGSTIDSETVGAAPMSFLRSQYIGGSIYAITYMNGSHYLVVKTVSIVGGLITDLDIQTFTDSAMYYSYTVPSRPYSELVNVYGEIWAVVWSKNASPYDASIRTIQIDDLTGAISAVDSWETINPTGNFLGCGAINVGSNDTEDGVIIMAMGYDYTTSMDAITIDISNTGVINEEIVDSLELSTGVRQRFRTIIEHVDGRYVTACGSGTNGYAMLVGVDTTPVGGGDEEEDGEDEGIGEIDNDATSGMMLIYLVPLALFVGVIVKGFAKTSTLATMMISLLFAVLGFIILVSFVGALG